MTITAITMTITIYPNPTLTTIQKRKHIDRWFESEPEQYYLVLPRSLMAAMPDQWQRDMVSLLKQMQQSCTQAKLDTSQTYSVIYKSKNGKSLTDPYLDYKHPIINKLPGTCTSPGCENATDSIKSLFCCVHLPDDGKGLCHASLDGDCHWELCPQLKDHEPDTSGRNCPRWKYDGNNVE
jgi:hypothetical protein